jgi:hypothetical protein
LLKQVAAAGAATSASAIITSTPAFAATGSCCTANDFYTLIGTCQANTPITNGCTTVIDNTITVCRPLATTTMTMSRTSAGFFRPYFDEVGVLTVTSPSNVTRSQNYIGWQNDCRVTTTTLPDLNGYGSGNGDPCANPSNGPTDVTALFGNECGLFTVRIRVRNGFTPYGWSTCYLRGS